MDNRCIGSKYKGEVVDIAGGSDASDDRKPTDGEGRDDSGHNIGNNEPLEHVEPTKTATQPVLPLRQSPSYQHGTDGGRMVDNDYRTRSPLRVITRQRRAKLSRTATPAISSARRSVAKLVDKPTPSSKDDSISV